MSYLYSFPWIAFYIAVFCCCIPVCTSQRNNIVLNYSVVLLQKYILLILPLFFVGFRGFLFTDWLSYYPYFNNAPTLYDAPSQINSYLGYLNWEKGFIWLTIIFKSIFNNYFLFQFFSFFVDYIVLLQFFRRNVESDVAWAIFFLFLFEGFQIEINLLRNTKAMMLFFISLKYLKQRKVIPYMLLNLCGLLFHTSALFYIPLYFILPVRFNRKIIFSLYLVGCVFFILNIQWITAVLQFVLPYLGFNKRLGILITGYMQNASGRSISIGFIERISSFLLVYHYEKKILNLNKDNRIYINAFYLYTLIFLFGNSFAIIYQRIGLLFVFSYWIVYPLILKVVSNKDKKVLIAILFLYGLLKNFNGNKNILCKYNNYLIHEPNYQEYTKYFEIWSNK